MRVVIMFCFYLFIEREEGREKEIERETLMCERYTDWPATQAGALTGNRTGDLLVCRLALNPLSHTSQGTLYIILI